MERSAAAVSRRRRRRRRHAEEDETHQELLLVDSESDSSSRDSVSSMSSLDADGDTLVDDHQPQEQPPMKKKRRSTHRRLRKMSQEFFPTSFCFGVQTHLLCVGCAAVYRVAISITTENSMRMAQPMGDCMAHSWVIAMSQSKFATFFFHACGILSQGPIAQFFASQQKKQLQIHRDVDMDECAKPLEEFLVMLVNTLNSHATLQNVFVMHEDVAVMNQNKCTLESFLTRLWTTFELMIPTLAYELHCTSALGKDLVRLYVLIRDFLALPENILTANSTYAGAVLSLEDVYAPLPHADQLCSICLESIEVETNASNPTTTTMSTDDENEIQDDLGRMGTSTTALVTASSAPSSASGSGSSFSVRLPCSHIFHENCVMTWLRHNPSCPDCRAAVGKPQL